MAQDEHADEHLSEEPSIDVCQGYGCYFSWEGVMRQRKITEMKVVDGAAYQRCYRCL